MKQSNLLVFELGVRRTRPGLGSVSTTLAVHPMVTRPSSWTVADRSRSMRQQTLGAANVTKGGRALRDYRVQGTFGAEVRGFGPFVGDGEQRRRLFEREIVRLPDAAVRGDLDEVLRATTSTPGLKQQLLDVDLGRDVLFLNVYDFWHGRSFEAIVRNFEQVRDKRGSARGLAHYQLHIEELGPIVHEGVASQVGQAFVQGLAGVSEVTATIGAVNLDQWSTQVALSVVGLPLTLAASALRVVQAQTEAVSGIIRGTSGPRPALFIASRAAANALRAIRRATTRVRPARLGSELWQGSAEPQEFLSRAAIFDGEEALAEVEILGGLVGLSDTDWLARVEGGRRRPSRGARVYRVAEGDDLIDLEAATGARIEEVLQLGDLTVDEALQPGQPVPVPTRADDGEPRPIEGLPTWGSHQGLAALGSDLTLEMEIDPTTGDYVVVEGARVLEQGLDALTVEYASQILAGVDTVPDEGLAEYLSSRLRAILRSDPRVASVLRLDLEVGSASVDYGADVVSIGGLAVTVGGG